ncbi:MAG: DUF1592 domain-containing protein [Limisphaerales bacterium]
MKATIHVSALWASLLLSAAAGFDLCAASDLPGVAEFHKTIQPMLQNYCFDCHGDGASKGNVAFDQFKSDQAALENRDLWWKALKNVRAGIMPPANKPRPSSEEQAQLAHWIKTDVFGIDPQNPDPGRITIRRLNRAEYHNTIRDLTGVDFDTQTAFPPDDTGYGFDTIGDVLTLPPMLLEKYLSAAKQIIARAVPLAPGITNAAAADNYARYFPKPVPAAAGARRRYAQEILGSFAQKAFRHPVDDKTVKRLAALAESVYSQPAQTFQAGVAQAMVAVLASPRFLFREENIEAAPGKKHFPFVDEYSLASRLSYFLWSSMPDDELMRLAGEGRLRQNLSSQVARLLRDKRSQAFVRNFTGQWLRARDIEGAAIDARSVLARDENYDPEKDRLRQRFRELRDKPEDSLTDKEKDELDDLRVRFRKFRQPRVDFNRALRNDMRQETQMAFDYVLREDRSLLELLDCNYTFLNQRLAAHYGITNVSGNEMRLVTLPPDSPRGGVLTEGTFLVVTSNPTRTSPVKRGLFILGNILGTPPPPPPPNIPALEDAAKGKTNGVLSLRETLALHRKDALCASCHNRMDPLGLAFENFNALGIWRDTEFDQPIDSTGKLTSGESFANVKQLKRLLVADHATDFYRTLAEKMLTYALGRGLEDYDVETVDSIVARLEASHGRPSALLSGVVESAPFQRRRKPSSLSAAGLASPAVALNSTP